MRSAHDLPREGKRPSVKLTVETVRTLKLPPGKTDYTFFDAALKGFGLRLRDSGSRNFIFQHNIGKVTRRIVIGSAAAITVGQAREAAQKLYLRAKAGDDPAGDKAVAKQQAVETFKAAIAEYLEHARKNLAAPDLPRRRAAPRQIRQAAA